MISLNILYLQTIQCLLPNKLLPLEMADREGATDQRQSDSLADIQQAILKGTRCFETDDVDDSGILLELRQCLRGLQILHIDQDNARHIGDHAQ